MGSATRLRAGAAASLREFGRAPVNLALLALLPPAVILVYGQALAAFPDLPFMDVDPSTLGFLNGAVFAAAFLSGVVGLFQVIAAASADERLAVAGFGRTELFAARLVTVAVASLAAAGVSLAVMSTDVTVAAPVAAFGALALAAGTYGLLGMLVGTVVPRELEGSLVLVFVADVDDALASGIVEVDSALTNLFPLHYPHALFEAAVTDGTVPTGDALAGAAYLLALLAVAGGAYVLATGEGGVLA